MIEVVNRDSSIFVCCARDDAVHHARVLRSALGVSLGRGCAIGGGAETAALISRSDLFVVLLTRRLLLNPIVLFEIWTALSLRLRIVTVAITGGGYDFGEASSVLLDMQSVLSGTLPTTSARTREITPKYSTAAEELQALIMGSDPDTTVAEVGDTLHASLTAVIALAWTPQGSKNHLAAVVDDILLRMPPRRSQRRQFSIDHPGGGEGTPAAARGKGESTPNSRRRSKIGGSKSSERSERSERSEDRA
jgi:hypothetical protein|eukprot:1394401-Prymnesium_polylepis.1